MKDIEFLSKRLSKLESKIFKESKQVGKIYHFCTLDSFVKYIIPKDTLSASGGWYNTLTKSTNMVSFTRNKNFIVDTIDPGEFLIRIEVDGTHLTDRYKSTPYADINVEVDEAEESFYGPLKNISQYINVITLADNKVISSKNINRRSYEKKLNTFLEQLNALKDYCNKYDIIVKVDRKLSGVSSNYNPYLSINTLDDYIEFFEHQKTLIDASITVISSFQTYFNNGDMSNATHIILSRRINALLKVLISLKTRGVNFILDDGKKIYKGDNILKKIREFIDSSWKEDNEKLSAFPSNPYYEDGYTIIPIYKSKLNTTESINLYLY